MSKEKIQNENPDQDLQKETTAAESAQDNAGAPEAEATETLSAEEALQKKVDELNDRYLRLSAEFDNYRKRTHKEKIETLKNAGEDIFKEMLPVIDDFEPVGILVELYRRITLVVAVHNGIHYKFAYRAFGIVGVGLFPQC